MRPPDSRTNLILIHVSCLAMFSCVEINRNEAHKAGNAETKSSKGKRVN